MDLKKNNFDILHKINPLLGFLAMFVTQDIILRFFFSKKKIINNGFINFKSSNKNNKIDTKIKQKEDKKVWPELFWNNNKNIEIISNETILNSVLLGKNLPNY